MEEKPAIEGGEPVRDEVLGYGSQSINEQDRKAVVDVLDNEYITRGPKVEEFEQKVADYVGTDYAVAVTSGTAALHLAGKALELSEGDEVITAPLTFAATAFSATYSGAKPVFADIKKSTKNIDPTRIEQNITDDTKAIVPVHYAGQPCETGRIQDIADRNNLRILWDASHALGSRYEGQIVGSERDAAVFSFHPVKNITTAEGGMVVTDDEEIAERLRSLRSFDMNYRPEGHEDEPWYQVVEGQGYNYNLTDLQAALGISQLNRINDFKKRRDRIFLDYNESFEEVDGIKTPEVKSSAEPMWHLYTVEITEEFGCSRKRFVNAMHAENIGVQVHYVPLHLHPYFQKEFGYQKGDFPLSESVYNRIVSLPIHPYMEDSDVRDVVEAIKKLKNFYD